MKVISELREVLDLAVRVRPAVAGRAGLSRTTLHRRSDATALVHCRQKRAAVILRPAETVRRRDRNEPGDVFVRRPQPVKRPRAERRTRELRVTRVHFQEGLGLLDERLLASPLPVPARV